MLQGRVVQRDRDQRGGSRRMAARGGRLYGVAVLVVLGACDRDAATDFDGLTYLRDVEPLFVPLCGETCHDKTGQAGGLELWEGQGWSDLVDRPSITRDVPVRVTPFDLEESYLWHKLVGTHLSVGGVGDLMPPEAPLDDEALDIVASWILAGAVEGE